MTFSKTLYASCLIFLLMIVLISSPAKAGEEPYYDARYENIQDEAQLFSEKQKEALQDKARDSESINDVELAIITKKNFNDIEANTYANKLFKEYQVGVHSNDLAVHYHNGVLILFNQANHEVVVHTDDEMKHYFSDDRLNQIIKETTQADFSKQHYEAGLEKLFDRMRTESAHALEYAKKHHVPSVSEKDWEKEQYKDPEKIESYHIAEVIFDWTLKGFIFSIIAFSIAPVILYLRYRKYN